jgi:hypothetical protein
MLFTCSPQSQSCYDLVAAAIGTWHLPPKTTTQPDARDEPVDGGLADSTQPLYQTGGSSDATNANYTLLQGFILADEGNGDLLLAFSNWQ